MHSSTSNFERPIPAQPWRGIAVLVVIVTLLCAIAWEVRCRTVGYGPTLNDTEDLWAQARRRLKPGSVVIIGDSRAWFDSDLDELERGLGSRPVQLAQPGSCAFPVLEDLANDEAFHGTIVCSVVSRMFCARRSTRRKCPKSREAFSHADFGAARQAPLGGAAGGACGISQRARPNDGGSPQKIAHPESSRRARSAAHASLFPNRRP